MPACICSIRRSVVSNARCHRLRSLSSSLNFHQTSFCFVVVADAVVFNTCLLLLHGLLFIIVIFFPCSFSFSRLCVWGTRTNRSYDGLRLRGVFGFAVVVSIYILLKHTQTHTYTKNSFKLQGTRATSRRPRVCVYFVQFLSSQILPHFSLLRFFVAFPFVFDECVFE